MQNNNTLSSFSIRNIASNTFSTLNKSSRVMQNTSGVMQNVYRIIKGVNSEISHNKIGKKGLLI